MRSSWSRLGFLVIGRQRWELSFTGWRSKSTRTTDDGFWVVVFVKVSTEYFGQITAMELIFNVRFRSAVRKVSGNFRDMVKTARRNGAVSLLHNVPKQVAFSDDFDVL